jgi:hypothetical protein
LVRRVRSPFTREASFLVDIRVSTSISGIDWVATAAQNSGRPSVASISIAGTRLDSVDTAAANLVSSGVTTVACAGNNNADVAGYSPGDVTSVIAVGASDINDAKASYSNYGASLDIWAPGAHRQMLRSQKLTHLLR